MIFSTVHILVWSVIWEESILLKKGGTPQLCGLNLGFLGEMPFGSEKSLFK